MTLKVIAALAIINVVAFSGNSVFQMSVQASDTNIQTKTDEKVAFIPAGTYTPNIKYNNKEIICSATAYTGGGRTATGKPCKRDKNGISTISVDPSVIPLGSMLYIEGYGYAEAADTGSAVKGNKIDVYFNSLSECYKWGSKNVKVTVIGPCSTL